MKIFGLLFLLASYVCCFLYSENMRFPFRLTGSASTFCPRGDLLKSTLIMSVGFGGSEVSFASSSYSEAAPVNKSRLLVLMTLLLHSLYVLRGRSSLLTPSRPHAPNHVSSLDVSVRSVARPAENGLERSEDFSVLLFASGPSRLMLDITLRRFSIEEHFVRRIGESRWLRVRDQGLT